ncbi:DUF429 domain-containing protein [Kitasatospora paracochleata]|uniref:RNase H-like nuclease n=1 Tax=Kitasatospora paracochleata TaxID=58354 RepID=A0ABT1J9P4_9ACTN|nr:DUF429 domain-containing protein [Kitasatospora paracochleata]MCP2313783.1 putative RNase H-like nuclease [Kitasatospora paracochleata]
MTVLGVDGCRGGWVGIALVDGRFQRAWFERTLAELLGRVPEAEVVAVDIPLGLLETGRRQAEALARPLLSPHGSRIFSVPPRAAWVESDNDRAAADRISRQFGGGGMSAQTWGLKEKVRDARPCWEAEPQRLIEVHPELSFRELAGGATVRPGKKTWNGTAVRRRLLAAAGIVLPDDLGGAGTVPPDDCLDAAAAAWSAQRYLEGRAVSLPDPPEPDRLGRPVAVRY